MHASDREIKRQWQDDIEILSMDKHGRIGAQEPKWPRANFWWSKSNFDSGVFVLGVHWLTFGFKAPSYSAVEVLLPMSNSF